ncbi:MAG: hypothetical protein RIS76_755 [Verrucomicrobiota bacterium]|jgi:hypothetical protein
MNIWSDWIRRILRGTLGERMLGAFDETISGGGDLLQLWFKLQDCRIGPHRFTLEQRRVGRRIITTVTHTAGDAPLSGLFWLSGTEGAEVTTNGRPVKSTFQPMQPSGMERASLDFELTVGAKRRIEQDDR